MSAGLESGCDNDIDAGMLQRDGFVGRCRGADRDDAVAMTVFKNLSGRNAEDEGEDGHLGVEQNARLVLDRKSVV